MIVMIIDESIASAGLQGKKVNMIDAHGHLKGRVWRAEQAGQEGLNPGSQFNTIWWE
jgi:hypothetical protein